MFELLASFQYINLMNEWCLILKRIVGLMFCLLLLSGTVAFASSNESNNSESKNKYDIEIGEVINKLNEKNQETLKKIKADADFEVIYEDKAGNYQYIPSERIKTINDFNRYNSKNQEFEAQKTQTVTGSKSLVTFGGYLHQTFTDKVIDDDPWFGDETITVDGQSNTYWCQGDSSIKCGSVGPTLKGWDKLISQQDVFTFNYTKVSSVSAGVALSPKPTVSATWTATNSSASYTTNWPDMKTAGVSTLHRYGTISLTTEDVTGYTHTSSAMATFPGPASVNVIANKYVSIK